MTSNHGWVCDGCTFENEHLTEPVCEICSRPAPDVNSFDGRRKSTPISENPCFLEQTFLRKSSGQTNPIEIICLDDSDDDKPYCNRDPIQLEDWICRQCAFANRPDHSYCHECGKSYSKSYDTVNVINFAADQNAFQKTNKALKCYDIEVIELDPSENDRTAAAHISKHHAADAACYLGNGNVFRKEPLRRQKEPNRVSNGKKATTQSKENNRRKVALNKSRKLGAYFWSEILVHIPDAVWMKYRPFIAEAIDVLHGEINVFSVSNRQNWVTWERKVIHDDLDPECFDKSSNRLTLNENCPVSTQVVPFSTLFYEATDFIAEYESGKILGRVKSALQSPEARVALIVFDLRRIVRLRANKAMRKQLSQSSAGVSESSDSKSLSTVSEIEEFVAFLIDHFNCRCSFLNFASLREVGMFLAQTTRHIAQEPYKPDATSSLGFRYQNVMKSAVVGGIFTPSMKEWFNVLIRIPGISPKRAESVIKRYPCCASLLFAYGNCRSDEERKLLLKDIDVEGKKLGLSVSSVVFDYLYSG